jgi:hypothetical protein
MQLHTKRDALLECLPWLVGLVNSALASPTLSPALPTLHPPLFVLDLGLNYTIANRLAHDVLCVFFRVQRQLLSDCAEGNARVSDG